MKGTLTPKGFDYENYSNGRWGVIAGTRFGKTFNDLTLAAHVEYLRTFGNHNNQIAVDPIVQTVKHLPAELSVNLKSTSEWTAGFDTMYQLNKKWSFGLGFEYVEHADNGVESVYTNMNSTVAKAVAKAYSNMEDGWDEYVIKLSAAYQMNDTLQLAPFFEYTFDHGHAQSQNATDYKYEIGVRLNAQF